MNRQELKQILSSRFDFEQWKELLGQMFPKVEYLSKPIELDANLVKNGGQVGTIRLNDGRALGLFKFEVADNIIIARNRKGLRDIAIRYVDQDIIHGAIVLYYSNNQEDYRLTFVSKQTSFNAEGTLVTSATAPKRFTFLLGSNEPCTTATNRLIELVDKTRKGSLFLVDVEDAFSVDRLNKDFFNGYKERYNKFLAYLNEDSKENRDYVKKLLGRLVFLHFLQKKGWMGVPVINPDWGGGDKNYLYNLVKRYNGSNRLLSDVLEYLFFETLNKERTDDVANSRLGNNIKIPYLNGGLFDRDDIDSKDVDFPYAYFLELMEFFAMYNFTIDENDPDDAEIGVDPEMLGHIFENLLEDNKDKGAFYTPKEIVQYMSQESIAQYLKTYTEESLHSAVDELVKMRRVDDALQDKESALKVYQLLCNVKVCDPAIGSGAFPMGVLNVLYHSRLLLYGFTNPSQSFSPATVKRDIIQNNIYGVDIEKGAIDIARLRFWLSIVVDSEKPEPLPNFDYKFMQGNSLVESYRGKDLSQMLNLESKKSSSRKVASNQYGMEFVTEETQKNLKIHLEQYFSIDNHKKKEESRKLINDSVRSYIRQTLFLDENDADVKSLRPSENQEFFLWHTWFKDIFDQGGFDIVIGNPPYIQLQADGGKLGNIYKTFGFETFARTGDIYSLFYEQGWNILKRGGILCFITSNTWMRANYGENTRKFFADKTNPLILIDLGADIFENATVETNILLFAKSENIKKTRCISLGGEHKNGIDNMSLFVQQQGTICEFKSNESWVILSPIEQSIKCKIESVGTPLKDWNIQINYGIKTGCNEAFIITTEKRDEILSNCETEEERRRTAELIRPILRGRDIKRYSYNWAGLWLINTHNGVRGKIPRIDINDYPAIKQHLDKYWNAISIRADKGDTPYNLRNCAYLEDLSQPKIVWIELSDEPKFAISDLTPLNTVFYLTGERLYDIIGMLNSNIYKWYFTHCIGTTSGVGTNRWLKYTIEQLPLIKHSINLYQITGKMINNGYNEKLGQAEIDKILFGILNLTNAEIDVIKNCQ